LSDTTDVTSAAPTDQSSDVGARRRRAGTGLTAMLLPELQTMASSLGVQGTARMRKGELIAAIQELQGGGRGPATRGGDARTAPRHAEPGEGTAGREPALVDAGRSEPRAEVPARVDVPRGEVRSAVPDVEPVRRDGDGAERGRVPVDGVPAGRVETDADSNGRPSRRSNRPSGSDGRGEANDEGAGRTDRGGDRGGAPDRAAHDRGQNDRVQNDRVQNDRSQSDRGGQNDRGDRANNRDPRDSGRGGQNDRPDRDDDDTDGGRRNRRSRYRDRRGRTRTDGGGNNNSGGERGGGGGGEPQVTEDDVLIPVAGIVDVLDNYAFVRTSGYLSGSNDVYVSMAQIKRYGLRRGDAVTGAVRTVRDTDQQGGRRDKYNPLIRLDTINGMDPEEARRRPEFYKLTPLYPQERLRLETEPNILTTRVIDLVMPIGKGQRALIVSPPKAGKTMVLQAIANAITHNNPECHLMVVLVDERPEEVTDMQRSVKGEVIASTFDRPPSDHTTVSELSIERAKRLVELGHDVVVLLDSITRLGRRTTTPRPRRAGSCPVVSTPPRCTRPSASSAPPVTSRTVDR